MTITHILKDGTRTETIQGHIVKIADVPEAYAAIKEGEKHGNQENQS